jgi:hypothetical protein
VEKVTVSQEMDGGMVGHGDGVMGRSGYQDIRGIGDWELSLNAEFGVRNAESEKMDSRIG